MSGQPVIQKWAFIWDSMRADEPGEWWIHATNEHRYVIVEPKRPNWEPGPGAGPKYDDRPRGAATS